MKPIEYFWLGFCLLLVVLVIGCDAPEQYQDGLKNFAAGKFKPRTAYAEYENFTKENL